MCIGLSTHYFLASCVRAWAYYFRTLQLFIMLVGSLYPSHCLCCSVELCLSSFLKEVQLWAFCWSFPLPLGFPLSSMLEAADSFSWGLTPRFWMLVLNVSCWLLESLVSCHVGWHYFPAQSLWPVLGTLDLWFSMVAFEFFTNKHQNIKTKPIFCLLISVSEDHTLVANNWSYISGMLYGRIS